MKNIANNLKRVFALVLAVALMTSTTLGGPASLAEGLDIQNGSGVEDFSPADVFIAPSSEEDEGGGFGALDYEFGEGEEGYEPGGAEQAPD
ncbi:MAG: hypothetical protein FWE19_09500, partial [Oscillospiraceae bacterium]|nr:hypothetical protein [Oscillospiraceae bacterium]